MAGDASAVGTFDGFGDWSVVHPTNASADAATRTKCHRPAISQRCGMSREHGPLLVWPVVDHIVRV